jgi:ubiquinone/menaquinone biosynthesis C-methylase UbiE
MVNAQYNIAKAGSLPARIAGKMRRQMFDMFLRESRIAASDTILDVGATSDRTYDHSNYLEAWYPHKDRITAVGIDDASFLEKVYPGLTFRQANGLNLPFTDNSFDFVHSSAVLEHVGCRANQRRFITELYRVCRRGLFLTTPNRWYPIEFHTVLPLVHWLPPRMFRSVLVAIGREFFAKEENLNLLGRGELAEIAAGAGLHKFTIDVVYLGMPSNLILIETK